MFRFCINRANMRLSTNTYIYVYLFTYLWDLNLYWRQIVCLLCEVQAADMVSLYNGVKLFLKTYEPRLMKNLIM